MDTYGHLKYTVKLGLYIKFFGGQKKGSSEPPRTPPCLGACNSREGGDFSGRIGEEKAQVVEASLQYCCYVGYWDAVSEEQDSGKKAVFCREC